MKFLNALKSAVPASDKCGMRRLRYPTYMLFSLLICAGTISSVGCGSGIKTVLASPGTSTSGMLAVSPSTAAIDVGSSLSLSVTDASNAQVCQWVSSDEDVLEIVSAGNVFGKSPGTATVSAECGSSFATASVAVSHPPATTITITKGGTYTGDWKSDDPNTPAVTVTTDDPVTITNSVISGRGTLIRVYGAGNANVTITNTTGIGMDPMVAGMARGKFVDAEKMASITVQNCTMRGTSFGVDVASSTMTALSIKNNVGIDLDDRVSDGMGGTILNERVLGHFIILNQDSLLNGGEIAWNQIINAPGKASIEDIINVYESHGKDKATPLRIHDNYLEGAFAAGQTTAYTGSGIQFDGGTNDPTLASGFADVSKNVVVRTANTGISIAAGHDISIRNNRVVSCGQDGLGHWDNFGGVGFPMWNDYNTQQFFNNTMSENTGGLVRIEVGEPTIGDLWVPSFPDALRINANGNHFDDPCWVNGVVSQSAEAAERSAWLDRVAQADEVLGDTHISAK